MPAACRLPPPQGPCLADEASEACQQWWADGGNAGLAGGGDTPCFDDDGSPAVDSLTGQPLCGWCFDADLKELLDERTGASACACVRDPDSASCSMLMDGPCATLPESQECAEWRAQNFYGGGGGGGGYPSPCADSPEGADCAPTDGGGSQPCEDDPAGEGRPKPEPVPGTLPCPAGMTEEECSKSSSGCGPNGGVRAEWPLRGYISAVAWLCTACWRAGRWQLTHGPHQLCWKARLNACPAHACVRAEWCQSSGGGVGGGGGGGGSGPIYQERTDTDKPAIMRKPALPAAAAAAAAAAAS